jgi:hypothetical protein
MKFLKESWWLIAATLIAGFEVVFAVGIQVDRANMDDPGPQYGDILLSTAAITAALAILIGIRLRSSQPRRASMLMTVGLVPAALAGIVFFWFPPFWALTVLAIALIVKVNRTSDVTRGPVPA